MTSQTSASGQDFASVLERAIQRNSAGKPIKLIEAKAVEYSTSE
jgi:hypothetical protein